MKKFNIKNYLFISLVLIVSFLAFSDGVKAYDYKNVTLYSYSDDKVFNSVDMGFATTAATGVTCSFDGDEGIVTYEKTFWKDRIVAVSGKAGKVKVDCKTGNTMLYNANITVYNAPVEKTVSVKSGETYIKENFISENLGLHLGENYAANGDYSSSNIYSNDGSNWVNDGYSFTAPASGTGIMDVKSRYINGKTISIAKVILNVNNNQTNNNEEIMAPISLSVGEDKTIYNVGISPQITFNTCSNGIATITTVSNNLKVHGNNSGSCNFIVHVGGTSVAGKNYRYTVNVNNRENTPSVDSRDINLKVDESQVVNVGKNSQDVGNNCGEGHVGIDRSDIGNGNIKLTGLRGLSERCKINFKKTDGGYVQLNVKVEDNSSNGGSTTGSNKASATIGGNRIEPTNVTGSIRADGLCDTYLIGFHASYRGATSYYVPGRGATHNMWLYQATDKCNNNVYTALCYDPRRTNPNNDIYDPVAYVNPFDDVDAFETSVGTSGTIAKSAAIEAFALSIIQNNFDEIQNSAKGKIAAEIAIRTFIYGNYLGLSTSSSGGELNYRELFCAWSGQCEGQEWTNGTFPFNEGIDGAGVLALAKEYWLLGNKAADTCMDGTCDESEYLKNIGYEVYLNQINDTCSNIENNNMLYTTTGIITGLDDYNVNYASITLKEFTCPTGYECNIYVGDRKIIPGVENNLKGFSEKETLKIEIKGNICDLPTNLDGLFDLVIESYHPGDWRNVITVKPRSRNLQRMILITEQARIKTKINAFGDGNGNGSGHGDGPNKAKCNCSSCGIPSLTPGNPEFNEEEFKRSECCTNPNKQTGAQSQWVNSNGGAQNYCASSTACGDVEWDVYCGPQDGDTLSYHIREAHNNVTNQTDYKKCVIDSGLDRAGNTYVEKTVSYEGQKYCTVYCTEDWEMELPGYLKNVYAGTGFNLAIKKVEGKRTCFTNTIKVDEFKNKLNEKNQAIVNAANKYLKAKAALDAYNSASKSNITIESKTITKTDYKSCPKNSNGDSIVNNPQVPSSMNCAKSSNENCSAKTYTNQNVVVSSRSYPIYSYNNISGSNLGSIITSSNGSISGGKFGSATRGINTCDITIKDPETEFKRENGLLVEKSESSEANKVYYSLSELVNAYKTAYDNAVKDRDNLVNTFSSCYTWTNDFDLNDIDISYTYADSEMMNKITEGNNKFEVDGDISTKTTNIFCENGANPTFTNCNGSGNEIANNQNLAIPGGDISTGTLSNNKKDIPIDRYVQKVVDSSASYNIKGSFFVENTTGYVSYEAAPTREELNKQQYVGKYWSSYYHTDDRVVPVSTTLPQGVYEYQLRFENVGMYNGNDRTTNSKSTGRLIGGTDGKGAKSVLKSYGKSNETATTETCYFEIGETNSLCHCCGKEVEVTVVSLEVCPYGNCGASPGGYLSDNADLSYYARAVSLNDLNPNNRDLGSNWGGTRDGELYPFESQSIQKGQATRTEIERNGNSIYEEPQYSYTITPSGIVSIKNVSDNYSNNSLECNANGINCLSGFLNNIDDLNGITVNKRDTEFHTYTVDGRTLSWK